MSTTYQLYPYLGDGETSIPSIDLTEQSMQFDITVWSLPQGYEGSGIAADFENLTAIEVMVDELTPGHR